MESKLQQELEIMDGNVRSGAFSFVYWVRYTSQGRDGYFNVTMSQPIEYVSDVEMVRAACAVRIGVNTDELMVVDWKQLRGGIRPGQIVTETWLEANQH